MQEIHLHTLGHAVMITGFVFMMMVVVEYLNVLTGGVWQKGFRGSRWRQYLIAGLLGVTPGCLGAFAVVALYSHRVIGLGAVVAAMIATSGDESFVMLAIIPQTAFIIFLILFVVGIVAGYLTDTLLGEAANPAACPQELKLHGVEACNCFPKGEIVQQWKRCSPARGVLAVVLVLFISGLFAGQIGPPEWSWIKVTILLVSATALFVVSTVPDHFLEKHLWNHVARVHVPRIFLWTAGALLLMHLLLHRFHLQNWMQENSLVMLLIASMVGLVPESGPHLVFLTLFTEKAIPMSVLLASSIVQDGHGMLPLLAESRRDFFKVKLINLIVGIAAGITGYFFKV